MPTEQRIIDLKEYVEQWKTALNQITQCRDTLLNIQSKGFVLTDDTGNDLLQQKIQAADVAVLQHQKILTRMQSLLDRALSGENA